MTDECRPNAVPIKDYALCYLNHKNHGKRTWVWGWNQRTEKWYKYPYYRGDNEFSPTAMTSHGWSFHSFCNPEEAKENPIESIDSVLEEIGKEVAAAEVLWPPMNSAHEAYAVLLEEVDELWDHVKTNQKRRDIPAMRKEALQVAAMAVRFVRDICNEERGRK